VRSGSRGAICTIAFLGAPRFSSWTAQASVPDGSEQHIEAPHPGHLLCQDTYYFGTIKGVRRIYLQSVVDAHSSPGFGKVYVEGADDRR